MRSALGNCVQTLQFGRPYFVPTMQRATPGILTFSAGMLAVAAVKATNVSVEIPGSS